MAHHLANATAGAFSAKTGARTMPSSFRRPGALHTKLRTPDWYVSSLMMERALDAIMRRVKHFDRKHDVPYLAGYSLDGKTIYIDRHMPKSLKVRGRTVMTDRFLVTRSRTGPLRRCFRPRRTSIAKREPAVWVCRHRERPPAAPI
jgi:hypothetical protein